MPHSDHPFFREPLPKGAENDGSARRGEEDHFFTTGNKIFNEINEASIVVSDIASGNDSTKRALVPSMTTIRGSLRNFQCRFLCRHQWHRFLPRHVEADNR